MSKIQGIALTIEEKTLKIIDGTLCGKLPEIFKPSDRQDTLNITVFSSIGSSADNYDTIVKNTTSTLQSTYLDHIKQMLINNKEELVNIVTDTIIDKCKIVDQKIKESK
jgi:hypothetical protein